MKIARVHARQDEHVGQHPERVVRHDVAQHRAQEAIVPDPAGTPPERERREGALVDQPEDLLGLRAGRSLQ